MSKLQLLFLSIAFVHVSLLFSETGLPQGSIPSQLDKFPNNQPLLKATQDGNVARVKNILNSGGVSIQGIYDAIEKAVSVDVEEIKAQELVETLLRGLNQASLSTSKTLGMILLKVAKTRRDGLGMALLYAGINPNATDQETGKTAQELLREQQQAGLFSKEGR